MRLCRAFFEVRKRSSSSACATTTSRCTTSRSDTKCANARHIKEGVARTRILEAIHQRLASREGKKHVRDAIAQILANHANDLDTRISDCRKRITKTEAKVLGLTVVAL